MLEARLAAAVVQRPAAIPSPVATKERHSTTGVDDSAGPKPATPTEPAAAATIESPAGFDDAAESAFLAEARDRGEVVKPRAEMAVDAIEEIDSKPLPSLDELVAKIPADVRDVLEDLFRARFVTVKRVPKKALKP